MSTVVNPRIFREYDIRGVVDKDLTDDVYYQIGRAYGTFLYAQEGIKPASGERMRVAAGRDVRLSSERFQKALLGEMTVLDEDLAELHRSPKVP